MVIVVVEKTAEEGGIQESSLTLLAATIELLPYIKTTFVPRDSSRSSLDLRKKLLQSILGSTTFTTCNEDDETNRLYIKTTIQQLAISHTQVEFIAKRKISAFN